MICFGRSAAAIPHYARAIDCKLLQGWLGISEPAQIVTRATDASATECAKISSDENLAIGL